MERKVVIHDKKLVFDGFFKIEQVELQHSTLSGNLSNKMKLLNFKRGHAVAVILFDRNANEFVCIEQFRYPTLSKTSDGWLLEAIAGMIDKNETPQTAAIRETYEETGYRVSNLKNIGGFYSSPGGSSEYIFLFYAETDGIREDKAGLEEENEYIQLVRIPVPKAKYLLDSSFIHDPKLIIGFNWFFNNNL